MEDEVELKVVKLREDIPLPSYVTEGAVGMDLHAAEEVILHPGEIKLVSTGIKVEVPRGYELQIRPRSGFAVKGIGIPNSPGTIDNDYRGEVKVCLINFGKEPFKIKKGDRIAQAVVSPVVRAKLICVNSLSSTFRGEGGFGHTGK